MPEHHKVPVVRITEILPIDGADKIGLAKVMGYQVVVRLDEFQVGDFMAYVPPDSVLPEVDAYKFLWEGRGFAPGEVPERYRRITARRFKKVWSEGYPIKARMVLGCNKAHFDRFVAKEGEDVAERLGITHYNPPEPGEPQTNRRPTTLKGWIYYAWFQLKDWLGFGPPRMVEKPPRNAPPFYDIEALKNFKSVLREGEPVVITEKIHGSQGKFLFQDSRFYVGSRKLWKSEKSNCIWREAGKQNPWLESWCRAHPGYTLFGEVVPTQKGFRYGCQEGQIKVLIFDIRTPDGKWLPWADVLREVPAPEVLVPEIYVGDFSERLLAQADGQSLVPNAGHIREGIVVKSLWEREDENLGRVILKVVSNRYYEKSQ